MAGYWAYAVPQLAIFSTITSKYHILVYLWQGFKHKNCTRIFTFSDIACPIKYFKQAETFESGVLIIDPNNNLLTELFQRGCVSPPLLTPTQVHTQTHATL